MRPDVVVVVTLEGQFLTSICETVEDLFIEAFIPQAAVEAFDQAILLRFAGVDLVPGNAGITRPFEDRGAGKFGAIITDDAAGLAINPDHRGQSRATRAPERLVSAINPGSSRVQSSLTARMRNLRDAPELSDTKSSDQRILGRVGTGISIRVPRTRFRPRRRRTDSPSSL